MARTIMKLLVVVFGLLFLVPNTMQLSVNHPLHAVVERLNKVEGGGYLALVISTAEDEILLRNSSDYQPDFFNPFIIFAGRTFNFGTFKYQRVVHVLAGKPSEPESKVRYPSLKIGEYNSPDAGNNSLGHITSLKTEEYEPTSIAKTYFFDVHSEWLEIASRLNFGERPTVLLGEGYRAGCSDIYVSNSAYGTFLNKKLNITIVDTSSAAVVATSIANGVPHIVIKGASNRPGLNSTSKLSETTKKNVLKTVSTFVGGLYWQSEKTHANVY